MDEVEIIEGSLTNDLNVADDNDDNDVQQAGSSGEDNRQATRSPPTTLNGTFSLDEGKTCSICFDDYTNAGEHKICCLPCGHIFGKNCLERWLGGRDTKFCPTCKRKCKTRDIRVLFCRGVQSRDTTELEHLRRQCTLEQQRAQLLELELVDERRRVRELSDQMKIFEMHQGTSRPPLKRFHSGTTGSDSDDDDEPRVRRRPNTRSRSTRFIQDVTIIDIDADNDVNANQIRAPQDASISLSLSGAPIPLCDDASSVRCSVYSQVRDTLLVACRGDRMFANQYGYKRVSLHTKASSEMVPCHLSRIRDIALPPIDDGRVLTGAEDATVKISSSIAGQVLHRWQLSGPVWACTFDSRADKTYIYAATQNGQVSVYDTRRPGVRTAANPDDIDTPMCTIDSRPTPQDGGPVTYLYHTQHLVDPNGPCALIGAKLSQVVAFTETAAGPSQTDESAYRLHRLAVHGRLTSLALDTYEDVTKQIYVTLRPTPTCAQVRHEMHRFVCDTVMGARAYTSQLRNHWLTGTAQMNMTRHSLGRHLFDTQTRVCATVFDEQTSTVSIYDAGNGRQLCNTRVPILSTAHTGAHHVVALPNRVGVLGAGKLMLYDVQR